MYFQHASVSTYFYIVGLLRTYLLYVRIRPTTVQHLTNVQNKQQTRPRRRLFLFQ